MFPFRLKKRTSKNVANTTFKGAEKRQYETEWYQNNNWDDKRPEFVRPGPDGVQGYCRKKLTTLHELIAK